MRFNVTLLTLATCAILGAQSVPNFIPPVTYVTDPTLSPLTPVTDWSAAADFNGDGFVDLIAADNRLFDNNLGFSILFAKPTGGYGLPVFKNLGFVVNVARSADFNRDGKADALVLGPSGFFVLLGDGAGGFAAPARVALPVLPGPGSNVAIGDFNHDGIPDIVAPGDGGFGVAMGVGDGTFRDATLYRQPTGSAFVMTADFNHDGHLDFAGPGGSIGGVTYLGNGDGTFRDPVSTIYINPNSVVGDFNNDGFPDFAMITAQARQEGSAYAITITRGWGDGTFSIYSNYVLGTPMSHLVAADFNGDGNLDLVTSALIDGQRRLTLFTGDGTSVVNRDPVSFPLPTSGVLFGADLDRNGSTDVIVSYYRQFDVFRSTRGNPPLLAQISLNPPSVVGGTVSTGTVSLGGIAPAGGVTLTLASDNPAAFFLAGPTVTIPAGISSATFQITSSPVAAATNVNISASGNFVTQSAGLGVVPGYSLSALTLTPASQYGIFTATGTVTLSGPADGSANISLISANSALATVPASVVVPPGASSADFSITLRPVTANTVVNISASLGGVTRTTPVTILKPADTVVITKAEFTVKIAQLKVEATSTSAAATITVYNTATGALLGTLSPGGGGKYSGTFTIGGNLALTAANPNVTINSSLGGTNTTAAKLK